MVYHIPALLKESNDGLNIQPGGIYVDVTFGGGGHSKEILNRLKTGKLIAFDQDEDAAQNIPSDKKFLFLNQNFRFLRNNLRFNNITSIDGLIADLGVSFHQFDITERGFTFRQDAPLDMRMNQTGNITAAFLLETMDEPALAEIFYRYGELSDSRRIAREIVAKRTADPLKTVNDLIAVVGKLDPL